MATKKAENNTQATQEAQNKTKKAQGYKVIGKHFKSKEEANNAIREVFKKGFKSTGLCVRGNEFVILFGSYDTEAAAKANLDAIKKAGFTAEIEIVE